MNFGTLESIVNRDGHRLSAIKLNFIGIRSKASKPNEFDDWFYLAFVAPALDDSKLGETTYLAAFQKLYNGLCIIDGYLDHLKVDGKLGPKTLAAISLYNSCYKDYNWISRYEITTTSGIPYLLKPLSIKGTAVLKPGVWKYKRGAHKNQDAFVQAAPVTVHRDNNKNDISEITNVTQTGFFGINIHRRRFGLTSDFIGKWSAGCQVFRYGTDFREVLNLADAFVVIKDQEIFNYFLTQSK